MAAPSAVDVKNAVHDSIAATIRNAQRDRAAVEYAESAFDPGDFATVTAELDDALGSLLSALSATN